MLKQTTTIALSLLMLAMFSLDAIAKNDKPKKGKCKKSWVVSSPQAQSFGTFTIESGSGTLNMGSMGNVTAPPNVALLGISPTTTFKVIVDNTNPLCGTIDFIVSWGAAPAALTGPGIAIPLTDMLVTEPTLLPTPTALPVTLNTPNLPITLTFQGKLGTSFPQTAGLYTSPTYTVDVGKVSISNTTTATSLNPINVIETAIMDFGTVAGGDTAGTVVLDTAGGRSIGGGAQILSTGPGNAGAFQISGQANLSYTLSVTGPAVLGNGSGKQMTANGFSDNSSGTIPATGIETFQIGATLNLAPLQAAGSYSTTTGAGASPYQVTVNYN